eukprot:508113-Prorocentrum_minimum.AAC.1
MVNAVYSATFASPFSTCVIQRGGERPEGGAYMGEYEGEGGGEGLPNEGDERAECEQRLLVHCVRLGLQQPQQQPEDALRRLRVNAPDSPPPPVNPPPRPPNPRGPSPAGRKKKRKEKGRRVVPLRPLTTLVGEARDQPN